MSIKIMNRNFGLDIMRAFSIWLVLIQHGGINIPGLMPLKIGGIGVEIFFVLSGFLIGGILFREIDKNNTLVKTLKTFWIRRWFRILPLYYALLLFKFIFIDDSIGLNLLYYVFFLQNNFYGINYFDVSWSLVIEEWFYIFAPIFLFVINRLFKSENKIVLSMIAFIICVNVFRLIYVHHGNVPYAGVNSNFPFRFDSLFLGVILSFLKHKNWTLFESMNSKLVFSIGVISFFGYLFYYWNLSHVENLIDQTLFPRTFGFFILPFTIALTVPYVSSMKFNMDKNLITKTLFSLINITSVLTYCIYLIHPFIYAFKINLIVSIAITYVLSWLVYRYFEKPILNYRDKITS